MVPVHPKATDRGREGKGGTCTSEGDHPNREEVDDVSLSGGEGFQPHIKHADEHQRTQSKQVTWWGRRVGLLCGNNR